MEPNKRVPDETRRKLALIGALTSYRQRCLWHIPYQAQYVLWKDAVKRKSEEWLHVVAELMEICAIRPLVDCPWRYVYGDRKSIGGQDDEQGRTTVSDGKHEG
jgi:hypothetical protein